MLNAALAEFSEHGFEQANVNAIAARAEVSKATIYSHFNTKENLFLEVFDHFLDVKMISGPCEWKAATFENELKKETRRFFSQASESPEARFFFRCMTADDGILCDELRNELSGRFIAAAFGKMNDLFEAGRQGLFNQNLDIEFVKHAMIGVILQSLRYHWDCERKVSLTKIADQVSEFILFGMSAKRKCADVKHARKEKISRGNNL